MSIISEQLKPALAELTEDQQKFAVTVIEGITTSGSALIEQLLSGVAGLKVTITIERVEKS